MGFLYGSYTKEEENFSLSKKMKEREDNLWTTQMTKFYKKVREFSTELWEFSGRELPTSRQIREKRELLLYNSTTDSYMYRRYNKILSCRFGALPVSLSTRTWLSPRQTTTEFTQQTLSNPDWQLSVLYTKQSLTHARARVRFRQYQHNNKCRKRDRERELLT